ncbi:MAG: 30S ribosomal protein S16 [Synergistaceae bacterium]|nr:30S ribosomal protein S16 [Synergistaceae bacterium]
MSVRIRLSRHGKKKAPFYRLVVTDSHSPRDGNFIEILGTYNPLMEPAEIKIDAERAAYWLKNGASPSDTAKGLLKKAGVIEAPAAE